jgi:hypothetical protein
MNDLFECIRRKGQRKKDGLGETTRCRILALTIIIFVLGIRLFFSILFGNSQVQAKTSENDARKDYNLLEFDPLNRLGKGLLDGKCQKSSSLCQAVLERERKSFPREEEYQNLLDGYPIEEMLSAIGRLDKETADFLIAIAKKESDWGKHAPSKDGQDCFNYWGYKGQGEKQVLGYSCFSTREEAIEKVGARISNLIGKGINTPEKMLVWKCGLTCAGHDPQGVRKWVADVESVMKSIKS